MKKKSKLVFASVVVLMAALGVFVMGSMESVSASSLSEIGEGNNVPIYLFPLLLIGVGLFTLACFTRGKGNRKDGGMRNSEAGFTCIELCIVASAIFATGLLTDIYNHRDESAVNQHLSQVFAEGDNGNMEWVSDPNPDALADYLRNEYIGGNGVVQVSSDDKIKEIEYVASDGVCGESGIESGGFIIRLNNIAGNCDCLGEDGGTEIYFAKKNSEWRIIGNPSNISIDGVPTLPSQWQSMFFECPELTQSLSITPAFQDVPETEGTSTFEVENAGTGIMNWTAESDASWLTIDSGASGTDSGTITVSYHTNSGEARIGTITVTAPGAENSQQTVEVRQAKNFFYCIGKLSAKTNLALIAREQEAYFAEHCAYSDSLEDIGVTVEDTSKYQYEIDVSSDAFTATATSRAPGIGNSGQGDDVWTINQDWNLENGYTTSPECSEGSEDRIIDVYYFLMRGILSPITIPDFEQYRCKGYQNEAVNSLKNIHTAAEAYRMDFLVYPDSIEKVEMAGWSAEPDAKYHYAIIVADGDTFLATATSKEPGIIDGGEGDDVWTINQDGELVNSVDACQTLPPPPLQPITERKSFLVLPFNGQINVSLTPELLSDASEDTGADRGQWQISTSSDFSSPVLDETGDLGETIDSVFKSHVVSGSALNEGTAYYWRVRYYNADNESSEWSDTFWFRTTGTSFAGPSLSVTPTYHDVTATNGTVAFDVSVIKGCVPSDQQNNEWTATSNASWLTIDSGASGINSGTISVSCEKNPGEARTGTITVTAPGAENSPQTVEVRQTACETHFTITASAETGGTISPSGDVITDCEEEHVFTIIPDTGYKVEDVLIDDSSVGDVTSYTFTSPASDHTIEAVFAADTFTVNFTTEGNGTLTGEASQSVEYGKNSAEMTAVPNECHEFTGWSGDHAGTGNPLIVENVTSDMNIVASFALRTCTVTFTSDEYGEITGETSQTIGCGGSSTPVTAEPTTDNNYRFAGWSGDYSGTENPLTLTNVTSDMTIKAGFSPPDIWIVSFTAAGGHGEVIGEVFQRVEDGEDCTPVEVRPEEGHSFVGWSGDHAGTENPLTIADVTDHKNIVANFKINEHTVNFTSGSHGSLTGDTAQTVEHGSDCTPVEATAEDGYNFTGWSGGHTGTETSLTITDVTENKNVVANFKINEHTVNFTSGSHGSLTGDTAQTVEHGSDCTPVEATAEDGYNFTGWSGGHTGTETSLTITDVTENKNIVANFKINEHTVNFTSGSHGSLTGDTSQTVEHGSDCTPVEATAEDGYHFAGWSGGHTGTETSLTITDVTDNKNVVANFAKNPDLSDAVLSLKVLTGMKADGVSPELDANGNGKVGMEDVVHILQIVADMRSQ